MHGVLRRLQLPERLRGHSSERNRPHHGDVGLRARRIASAWARCAGPPRSRAVGVVPHPTFDTTASLVGPLLEGVGVAPGTACGRQYRVAIDTRP